MPNDQTQTEITVNSDTGRLFALGARLTDGTIENVVGSQFNDRLTSQTNTDTRFVGGVGNDRLQTGTGNDTLDGGAGDDRLEGGEGDDVLIVTEGGERLRQLLLPGGI